MNQEKLSKLGNQVRIGGKVRQSFCVGDAYEYFNYRVICCLAEYKQTRQEVIIFGKTYGLSIFKQIFLMSL